MAKEKMVLNSAAIRALLRSAWTKQLIEQIAGNVAKRAGDGYSVRSYDLGTRRLANVYADSNEARKDNLENNTLIKAVGK